MSLDADAVLRIARLARLDLTANEVDQVHGELNAILGLIEQMRAVDTSGIEPMAHAQDVAARLREDSVTEHDQREAFQAIAPQTAEGLYLVPKVIE